MNQSKMPAPGEMKFVIVNYFKNAQKTMDDNVFIGATGNETEVHFKLNWKISFIWNYQLKCYDVNLTCWSRDRMSEWAIEASVDTFISKKKQENKKLHFCSEGNHSKAISLVLFGLDEKEKYFVDGDVEIEIRVTITDSIGERLILRRFDDELAKKFSDVLLIVGDRKFYVNRMYLASQSSFFEILFFGNFEESGKSEIELESIGPEDFQNFLEVIHGEAAVGINTLGGILRLADFFVSKTAMRQCELFLINSNRSLQEEFIYAYRHKMCELEYKSRGVRDLISKTHKTPINYGF